IASLTVSLFGLTAVFIIRDKNNTVSALSAYSDELKKDLDSAVSDSMPSDKLPAEAFTQALDKAAIEDIISNSATNIVYQNNNDFSLSKTLYATIYNNLKSYAKTNEIKISDSDVSKLASLEVDVISGFMSDVKTTDLWLYGTVRNKTAMLIIAVSIVAAISSFVLLHFVNDGRHRKNSYYGMAFASAGYIEIFGTLMAKLLNVPELKANCGYLVFDKAAADVTERIMNAQIPFGGALIFIGIIVLALNYRYFAKKNSKVSAQREENHKLRDEYMKHFENKNSPAQEQTLGERETMDVDF
ncbi:MAG: hypothetical protein IKF64_02390, partial [Eubacterium sp.]|nr:hypothetical protein [Eubacterium sp.]